MIPQPVTPSRSPAPLIPRHPRSLTPYHTPLQVRDLPLPGVGSVSGFSGSRKETELFFSFQSFAEPGQSPEAHRPLTVYRH